MTSKLLASAARHLRETGDTAGNALVSAVQLSAARDTARASAGLARLVINIKSASRSQRKQARQIAEQASQLEQALSDVLAARQEH